MTATLRTVPLPDGFFGAYVGDQRKQDTHAARAERATDQGLEPCETCGWGVTDGKGFIVVVTHGGSSVLHPEDDTREAMEDPGYMGGYVVGSTCAKSIPAEYRQTYTTKS